MAWPTDQLPLVTELLIDGTWTDISSVVRVADGGGVTITRGRADEHNRVAPQACSLVIDNRTGDYSNRNPNSPYFGLLGRNTQLRNRIRWLNDSFSRTLSNSWGSTEDATPVAWVNTGGTTPDEYDATGTTATHTHATVDQLHNSFATPAVPQRDAIGAASWSATATGANYTTWVALGTDTSNYYAALLIWNPVGNVSLEIVKRVAGSLTVIASPVVMGAYGAGVNWTARLCVRPGGLIRAKAWLGAIDDEPSSGWTLTVTDTSLANTTKVGLLSRREIGNTNVSPVCAWLEVQASDFRFWGETSAFNPVWNLAGTDVTVPVEAAGIMRRLGGDKPLRSALERAMAGISEGDIVPIAYWPLEDESGATQFASAMSGQPPATMTGDISPANYAGFVGSDPLPVLTAGDISGAFPTYTSTGQWQLQFAMMVPASVTTTTDLLHITMAPGGTVAEIVVGWDGGTDNLTITAYDSSGAVLDTDTGTSGTRDTPVFMCLSDFLDPPHTITFLQLSIVTGDFVDFMSITPGGSVGMPRSWRAQADAASAGWSFGHPALFVDGDVENIAGAGANARAANGNPGETSQQRVMRLCREEGIDLQVVDPGIFFTERVGPQLRKTLLDLLVECAEADRAILYEPRDALGLAYRTRDSLYNQSGLVLDYDAGQVFEPLQPIEDDQLTENDVTVKRPGGSSARVEVTTGPLSTQAPPNGVGVVDTSTELNVYVDTQLEPLAGWLAHLGTWDEARYPTVTVNLAAPGIASSVALLGQIPAVDIGDYLSITNPPSWLPPETIELLAQGSREFMAPFDWTITWNTTPAGPYKVFTLDDTTLCRLDGDQALSSSVTTTATSWSVKTNSGPVMTAVDAEDGWQWMVEGELVTVTDISGSSSPQTATVVRSVNGIVKAHAADAPVALFPAPHLAL